MRLSEQAKENIRDAISVVCPELEDDDDKYELVCSWSANMWKKIGAASNCNPETCKNYVMNEYSQSFFDTVSPAEIRLLAVRKVLENFEAFENEQNHAWIVEKVCKDLNAHPYYTKKVVCDLLNGVKFQSVQEVEELLRQLEEGVPSDAKAVLKPQRYVPTKIFQQTLMVGQIAPDLHELRTFAKALLRDCIMQKEKNVELRHKCQQVVRYAHKLVKAFE